MAKKAKSSKNDKPRERRERRFQPQPSASPWIAYLVGALGAVAMGAGVWEQFGSAFREGGPEALKAAPYILFAGALLVAVAIWLGTSGQAPLCVGDAGIGIEKGQVRRMPWYGVERIEWRGEAVRAIGKDEDGASILVVATVATHPQAAAWIVKEARERVPAVVDVPEDATLPQPRAAAGDTVTLDPQQVVGKRCAASGQIIAYEPDARVCRRCGRVYQKAHVPEVCACGGSLGELRSAEKAG
ncbi:MAG TPA: hypothetical protein VGY54_25250 [Polyangiaceae bacterium]|jgi:hypothetical protein|nr:hypothetical protein [Polyangiaceae bacterium]